MSAQTYKADNNAPDPDIIDPSYDEGADPDYDESSQGEFADEFMDADASDYRDPDSSEAPSQEWYARKQK